MCRTLFESWLSFQETNEDGLQAIKEVKYSRCTIRPIENATPTTKQDLMEKWLRPAKNPQQVASMLRKTDVMVTNMKDKELQIPILKQLNDEVITVLSQGAQAEAEAAEARSSQDKRRAATIYRPPGQELVQDAPHADDPTHQGVLALFDETEEPDDEPADQVADVLEELQETIRKGGLLCCGCSPVVVPRQATKRADAPASTAPGAAGSVVPQKQATRGGARAGAPAALPSRLLDNLQALKDEEMKELLEESGENTKREMLARSPFHVQLKELSQVELASATGKFMTGECLPKPSQTRIPIEQLLHLSVSQLSRTLGMKNDAMILEMMDEMKRGSTGAQAGIERHIMQYVHLEKAGSMKAIGEDAAPYDYDEEEQRPIYRLVSALGFNGSNRVADASMMYGMSLDDFADTKEAHDAKLEKKHVLALRLYTTAASRTMNDALSKRAMTTINEGKPHPLPATIICLVDAIERLRMATMGDQMTLYSGACSKEVLRTLEEERFGGRCQVMAPISATRSLRVALEHLKGENEAAAARAHSHGRPVLFRIDVTSRLNAAADLSWLSVFPKLFEFVFPPLTILQWTGEKETISLDGWRSVDVYNMTPYVPRSRMGDSAAREVNGDDLAV